MSKQAFLIIKMSFLRFRVYVCIFFLWLPEKNQFANFSHNTSFKKVHMKHLFIFLSKYKALYLLRNFAHLYSFGSLLFLILRVFVFFSYFHSILLFLPFENICEIYLHLALFTLYSGDHSIAIHRDVSHLECGFEEKSSSYKVSFLIT